jgi:serine/threonine-protein phosphatase 4 regulatory subunit 1
MGRSTHGERLSDEQAKLLNDMVESLGPDLCHQVRLAGRAPWIDGLASDVVPWPCPCQFVSPEMVSLAEDPVFRVRKAAALHMYLVCQVGGDQDTTERLLPAYIRLTKDDIYRVRKACAESLVDLSRSVNADLRSHVLVEVFLRLASDNSKFVRNAALQQLGPFIATLKGEEVTPDLLKLFVSMATPSSGDAVVDNDIRHYCAFSFPGVAVTVGPSR